MNRPDRPPPRQPPRAARRDALAPHQPAPMPRKCAHWKGRRSAPPAGRTRPPPQRGCPSAPAESPCSTPTRCRPRWRPPPARCRASQGGPQRAGGSQRPSGAEPDNEPEGPPTPPMGAGTALATNPERQYPMTDHNNHPTDHTHRKDITMRDSSEEQHPAEGPAGPAADISAPGAAPNGAANGLGITTATAADPTRSCGSAQKGGQGGLQGRAAHRPGGRRPGRAAAPARRPSQRLRAGAGAHLLGKGRERPPICWTGRAS